MSTPKPARKPAAARNQSAVAGPDRFAKVRAARSSEVAEDYVEAIADQIAEHGTCRVADLARHFGVSHVTVSRTVGRLVKSGLAETAPYKPVTLTAKGKRMAKASKSRHEIIVNFLRALGLDHRTAELDAEGLEHHVSPATLRRFQDIVDGVYKLRPDPRRNDGRK